MAAGVNAAVIAAAGVRVAFTAKSTDGGVMAAILGFAQAAMSAAVPFAGEASPEQTAVLMSQAGAAVAVLVRQISVPKTA
ncbi:hypothetical protein ACIA8R_34500 [Nonomuraea sp. NPDC051191]|uniref:hypothetical protein n=1 Tax=Nonomuraea sp. NPDC051191 TaxID=3364372 RepID=UPI0037B8B384